MCFQLPITGSSCMADTSARPVTPNATDADCQSSANIANVEKIYFLYSINMYYSYMDLHVIQFCYIFETQN